MKMRDELELYKTKTADLTLALDQLYEKHDLEVKTLVIAHNVEVSELAATHKKVVEQKDNTIKYRSDEAAEANRQLNNLHDILDVIPGVLPRKKVDENGYTQNDNACHVRLASVLAQKFM